MSLIYVGDLTFGYEGSVDNVFEHASFQLDTDWKLGLIGRNGRGKTTLLNLLLGRLDAHGAIHAAVDFVYFPFTVTHPERMACELAEEIVPHLEQWMLIREVSYLDVPPEALYRLSLIHIYAQIVNLKGESGLKGKSKDIIFHFHNAMKLFYRKHYQKKYSIFVTAAVYLGIWAKYHFAMLRRKKG